MRFFVRVLLLGGIFISANSTAVCTHIGIVEINQPLVKVAVCRLDAVTICRVSANASANCCNFAQSSSISQNKTSKKADDSEGRRKSEETKRLDRPALIFVKADREKIYTLLAGQMKQQKYEFDRKDTGKIVFSRRTTGVDAAIQRKSVNRTLTTPMIDDPRTIVAFILTESKNGFVVAGRMIGTVIIPGGQVASFDVSDERAARISLNKFLEKLKTEAERP